MASLEDYLDLLAAVEATAEKLGMAIVLEGYPPPRDPRLKMLQVTPDPGVIEVNIHPAHNWGELVEHTEFLYEAAHQTRLCAEKFMTDGRHTGTGGGNHFVIGGATPTDSPSCAAPSCWAAWWPTGTTTRRSATCSAACSSAPPARRRAWTRPATTSCTNWKSPSTRSTANRAAYGDAMPPWLVDRTLRNILVDVTGNTHRSEFCIDKLYLARHQHGPAGPAGVARV